MSPSALFAVVAISLAMALVVWTVLTGLDGHRTRTVANLTLGLDTGPGLGSPTQEEESTPGALVVLARRLTPSGSIRRLDRLLARAGRPPGWPLDRLLVLKLALGLGVGALSVLYIRSSEGPLPVLLGLATTVVCYFLPELLLHSRGQERSQAIQLELADTLDQMTIAVEAGLGFDSAMSRAGKNGTGPLAQELVRTLQEIRVGHTRRQAYESLATRSDVADLRRFVRAIIQADAYGISIADVLRTQAAEMRMKRRQRAEEKAMQIPVKV
ncbi:type II secretion system F family protein, partial [Dietzia sp. SLG310A2-38A2]|uniref:type II secretion system F family protein n=1 Tax=Dietzia sp. SLG310A2-38A2 TaxID=1630643 RepID=UPI003218E496